MRYILAGCCVLVSIALLGFVIYATHEWVSELGFRQTYKEITDNALSLVLYLSWWIGGLAFLAMGVAVLAPAKKQAKN
jgi:hypothetical protein